MTWLEGLIIFAVFIVALFLISAIKVLREYGRAVVDKVLDSLLESFEKTSKKLMREKLGRE